MTTTQVHLLMLGLGLLAYLFLAGLLTNRKSHSKRLRRQWWMGTIAAIAVALSPLSRFWRQPASGIELLTQSLLVAAVGLLAILLYALLRKPVNALRRGDKEDPTSSSTHSAPSIQRATSGSVPIVINADGATDGATDAATNSSLTQQSTNTTDEAIARSMHNPATRVRSTVKTTETPYTDELIVDDIDDLPTSNVMNSPMGAVSESQPVTEDNRLDSTQDHVIDQPHGYDINNDQADNKPLGNTDLESVVQLQAKNANTQKMDDKISQTIAANDNKSSNDIATAAEDIATTDANIDQNDLDLSETEQLFAELRKPQTEVELPHEDELRLAKENTEMHDLDFDTELIHEDMSRQNTTTKLPATKDVIEEAEVVDLDDTSLDFGNDLTGEYAHPTSDATQSSTATIDKSIRNKKAVIVPETLDAAIVAAKASALSLQTQVSNLEDSITELDGLRDSTIDATVEAAAIRAEHSDALLKQKDELLRSENEALTAAEKVIDAQGELIERAKREQVAINNLLNQERQRLAMLQQEVDRSRKMARSAANLARRAATAQQESKDIAIREQTARLKSQESTRKAVTIARNAISALAAEERKRNSTRR